MTTSRRPIYLLLAVGVVAAQALVLAGWGILEFVRIGGSESAGSAAAAGIFFLVCAGGLGACAWGLFKLDSWARAPIVLAQLLVLGLAWNARHSATLLAVVLAIVALVALVCIFHPASLHALAAEDRLDDGG